MPIFRFNPTLARLAFAAATAASPLCAPSVANAQDAGGKSGFFTRGFGGGGEAREPGAYVSPSAIPQASPGDLGVNLPAPLQKLDPIALPDLPSDGPPPVDLKLPTLPAYAPQNTAPASPLAPSRKLWLEARLVKGGPPIPSGLVWRLFSPTPGPDGKLPLVASVSGGSADFDIPPGSYLMYVGFGRAGVTRRIDFSGSLSREEVVLDAGGLKMNSVATGNVQIPPDKLAFSIYSDEPEERDRQLIVDDVKPGMTVPLNAGSYRVVSRYGDDNAEVSAEVKVEAGRTTEVTLQHRAAELTMKLVREKGGEAIADTAWQVTDADGTLVRQSVGAFPSMVLGEGDYLVVAKNRDKTYQRDFAVHAGVNADVELLTSEVLPEPDASEGSGD